MRNLSPLALTLTFGLLAAACSSSMPSGGTGSGGSTTGSGGHATGGSSSGGSTGASGGSTGSSGGTTGTGGVTATGGTTGSGGTTASGGATGSGGTHATGGTTGAGGSAASGGSAGSRASGGSTGSGGAGGAPTGTGGTTSTGGSTGSGDCAGLALCDTFESSTVGGGPSATLWTIVNPSDGAVTVDSIGAHGSSRSIRIDANQRLYIRNSSVISTLGPEVHARFYVRFMMALPGSHAAMMATHPMPADQYTQTPEFRFGSQDMVFHWNNTQGDVNVPDVSPQGDAMSFTPAAATWYCVELTVNTSNGHLAASVDGNNIAGLTEDGTPTPNVDSSWLSTSNVTSTYSTLADFSLGWASYGAGKMTLWFDDIALSSSPIGCAK